MTEADHPTIRTCVPFPVEAHVDTLRKAMKGLGTDEGAIIEVLTSCSHNQRRAIAEEYAKTHDRDFLKDLKKELSGDFEDVIVALMMHPNDFLAQELEHAIDHKNGEVIVQIMFTCEAHELDLIRTAFKKQDDDTLEEELKDELNGIFQDVLVATATGHRSEGFCELVTYNVARAIYNDDHGVDKEEVVKAFATLSFKQLKAIFVEYYNLAGRTLGEAFDLEFKGEERDNMKALFQCLQNRRGYLAGALKKAMAGPGTKDRDLIRLIVSRSEIDLLSIKEEYFKMYDQALEETVKGDTSGDYKKVLLALLKPNY